MVKYSIIIPTCNKTLANECLKYLSVINKPKEEYEVIVVHNVSNENFDDVINSYIDKIPNLKYFHENKYGQLAGRHRGLKEAKGDILCYIDDDSFVDEKWLIEIEKTFCDNNVILAGGNNLPLYEVTPPKWLKYFWTETPYGKYMDKLSLIDFNIYNHKLPTWYVFGCNFIAKKDIILKYGGFNPDVVPKNEQKYQGDGETALSLKLNKAGYYVLFNPRILIHHFVPKNRMTLGYLKKRAFYQGVSDSFSEIRKENGFDYYHFEPNENIDIVRMQYFRKKYNKIFKPLINKLDKNYQIYLYINEEYQKSYQEGFNFHRHEVKNDPELLKFVLKNDYLNE